MGSVMVPLDRALPSCYRLSIVTICNGLAAILTGSSDSPNQPFHAAQAPRSNSVQLL